MGHKDVTPTLYELKNAEIVGRQKRYLAPSRSVLKYILSVSFSVFNKPLLDLFFNLSVPGPFYIFRFFFLGVITQGIG